MFTKIKWQHWRISLPLIFVDPTFLFTTQTLGTQPSKPWALSSQLHIGVPEEGVHHLKAESKMVKFFVNRKVVEPKIYTPKRR